MFQETEKADATTPIPYKKLDLGSELQNKLQCSVIKMSVFEETLLVVSAHDDNVYRLTFYKIDSVSNELRLFSVVTKNVTQNHGGMQSACLISSNLVAMVFRKCILLHKLTDLGSNKSRNEPLSELPTAPNKLVVNGNVEILNKNTKQRGGAGAEEKRLTNAQDEATGEYGVLKNESFTSRNKPSQNLLTDANEELDQLELSHSDEASSNFLKFDLNNADSRYNICKCSYNAGDNKLVLNYGTKF